MDSDLSENLEASRCIIQYQALLLKETSLEMILPSCLLSEKMSAAVSDCREFDK